jgi:hypothetical protein
MEGDGPAVRETWTAEHPRFNELMSRLRDYVAQKRVDSVACVYGYGVRLSAPGYLDCTDWSFCRTKREALKEARELTVNE